MRSLTVREAREAYAKGDTVFTAHLGSRNLNWAEYIMQIENIGWRMTHFQVVEKQNAAHAYVLFHR